MALSIKTAEADELARTLSQLTGESMTEAVTVALRERPTRERAKHQRAWRCGLQPSLSRFEPPTIRDQ